MGVCFMTLDEHEIMSIYSNEYEKYINNTVFEICDENQQLDFLAWILKISDGEYNNGKEFLISHNASFRILWKLLSCINEYTIVLEDNYVDRTYRDSYYFYFSGKHFSYARFCKRISIFKGKLVKNFYDYTSEELNKVFIGTIVIRPIPNRSVGRALLNPHYFFKDFSCKIRLVQYNVTVYGKNLEVKAFPYSMQDGETTSCAEITILNLLDYYSQSYPEYRYLLPSEISLLAEKNSYERRMPTTGMSYELISKIFCDVGFYPRLYSTQKMSRIKFRHIMHYYIESGIPVALGLKLGEENKHSVICIGYSESQKDKDVDDITCAFDIKSKDVIWISDTADTVDTYCIMDDNRMPYGFSKCTEYIPESHDRVSMLNLNECEIEYMMVPLYKRMILEAADAYDICLSILASQELGIKNCMQQNITFDGLSDEDVKNCGTIENPLLIRLFMASSRTFRKSRDEQFNKKNTEIRDLYNMTIFPKFIWVCEVTTASLHEKGLIMGEILIDATSSADAKVDSSIIIHYPYTIGRRMPEDATGNDNINFEIVKEWNPFEEFHGNLTHIKK